MGADRVKTGTPKSAAAVPPRALNRESKYAELVGKLMKLRVGMVLPIEPDKPFADTPAGRKLHIAFRNRIAAVVRRATAELADGFTTYLTPTGIGVKRVAPENPKARKKASGKKAAQKRR